MDLDGFLASANLAQHGEALGALGCTEVADLHELTDDDCASCAAMKPLEIRRMRRKLGEIVAGGAGLLVTHEQLTVPDYNVSPHPTPATTTPDYITTVYSSNKEQPPPPADGRREDERSDEFAARSSSANPASLQVTDNTHNITGALLQDQPAAAPKSQKPAIIGAVALALLAIVAITLFMSGGGDVDATDSQPVLPHQLRSAHWAVGCCNSGCSNGSCGPINVGSTSSGYGSGLVHFNASGIEELAWQCEAGYVCRKYYCIVGTNANGTTLQSHFVWTWGPNTGNELYGREVTSGCSHIEDGAAPGRCCFGPTYSCGTLALSNWWTAQSDPHGRTGGRIQQHMPGSEAQARVACQRLCEQQMTAGVCAFKNYGGSLECWFSPGGTMIDYAARYGHGPGFRESASVCTSAPNIVH